MLCRRHRLEPGHGFVGHTRAEDVARWCAERVVHRVAHSLNTIVPPALHPVSVKLRVGVIRLDLARARLHYHWS